MLFKNIYINQKDINTATNPNLSASAQSAQQDGTLPGPSGIQQQTGPSRNHGAEVSTLLRSNF